MNLESSIGEIFFGEKSSPKTVKSGSSSKIEGY
jgi:hypothetical protein